MSSAFIFTLFARTIDPEKLRNEVRRVFPKAAEIVEGTDWKSTEVKLGGLFGAKRMTINHSVDYYIGPGWDRQKTGMQGYFSQGQPSSRQRSILQVISLFQFAVSFALDPAPKNHEDERTTFVFKMAEALEGVIFIPGALLDADGRLLLGVDGAFDPDAKCPGLNDDEEKAGRDLENTEYDHLPTAEMVACRALALGAVTARAVLERDWKSLADPDACFRQLTNWVGTAGVAALFEPQEEAIVSTLPGRLSSQEGINSMWRIEGLEVLAWALDIHKLPRYDQLSDVDTVWSAIGVLKDHIALIPAEAELRPPEELSLFQATMLALHWRIRQFAIKPERIDFRRFAQQAWFGPSDISELDLIDDELAIQGVRLDLVAPEVLDAVGSLVAERHLAINWLLSGGLYSETDTAT